MAEVVEIHRLRKFRPILLPAKICSCMLERILEDICGYSSCFPGIISQIWANILANKSIVFSHGIILLPGFIFIIKRDLRTRNYPNIATVSFQQLKAGKLSQDCHCLFSKPFAAKILGGEGGCETFLSNF